MDPSGGSGNQATVEIVEVVKSRWLRNQFVNRVVALTLTFELGPTGDDEYADSAVSEGLNSAAEPGRHA